VAFKTSIGVEAYGRTRSDRFGSEVAERCSFIRLRSRLNFNASYGERSRRSGSAVEADNHSDISDISPFRNKRLRVVSENYRTRWRLPVVSGCAGIQRRY